MDLEKIRIEAVELHKSNINRQNGDNHGTGLVDIMIDISSKVSKTMIEKYHEEFAKIK